MSPHLTVDLHISFVFTEIRQLAQLHLVHFIYPAQELPLLFLTIQYMLSMQGKSQL